MLTLLLPSTSLASETKSELGVIGGAGPKRTTTQGNATRFRTISQVVLVTVQIIVEVDDVVRNLASMSAT